MSQGKAAAMADVDDNTQQISGERKRFRSAAEFWMIVLSLVILGFTAIIVWSFMLRGKL
jgi:hypothetical protein